MSINAQENIAKENYAFTLDFKVRDYECDIQGIVNNSVYQNYLEHTRHEFLAARGLNFAELSQRNINLVVTRVEIDYRTPLMSSDTFWVGLSLERKSKIRGAFKQDIIRDRDQKTICNAIVHWASINEKLKPVYCPEIDDLC